MLFVNHHNGEATGGAPFCGSGAVVDEIVAVCTTHAAMHGLFDLAPLNPPWDYPEPLALGTVGHDIEVGSLFDGWGYVHLFDAETRADLDTFAIPEAMDENHAFGSGDLSVHEVATDPQDSSRALPELLRGWVPGPCHHVHGCQRRLHLRPRGDGRIP